MVTLLESRDPLLLLTCWIQQLVAKIVCFFQILSGKPSVLVLNATLNGYFRILVFFVISKHAEETIGKIAWFERVKLNNVFIYEYEGCIYSFCRYSLIQRKTKMKLL